MKNLPRTLTTNPVNAHFTSLHLASKRRLGLCALLALGLAVGLAAVRADTIYESTMIMGGMPNVWLPGFNPTNGQLVEVDLYVDMGYGFSGQVYNSSSSNCFYTVSVPLNFTTTVMDTSLYAVGGGTGYAGGSVPANSSVWCTGYGQLYCSGSTTQAADLAFFAGTNYVTIYVNIPGPTLMGMVSPSPPLYCGMFMGGPENGNVSLAYVYEPLLQTMPIITTNPVSATVSTGGSVTLSVGASGGGLNYQWALNGTNIVGATEATLTITNFCSANVGSYTVTVRNTVGSVTSTAATLASVDIKLFAGIVVNGPLGSNYLIQATSDLSSSNWTTLTNVALPTQPYIYIDYSSPTNQQQFYQAVPQ